MTGAAFISSTEWNFSIGTLLLLQFEVGPQSFSGPHDTVEPHSRSADQDVIQTFVLESPEHTEDLVTVHGTSVLRLKFLPLPICTIGTTYRFVAL